jgi:thiol-disulfide isomerase/thioredoxin
MKSVICLLVALFPCIAVAQKKFNVSITIPDTTVLKKLTFSYYDCQQRDYIPITASYNNNTATITHTYNTVYPHILIEYRDGDFWPRLTLIASDKPVAVTIPPPFNENDPFKTTVLKNARSINREYTAADEYIKEAQQVHRQLYDSIGANWKQEDTLGFRMVKDAEMQIDYKRLEYIAAHPNDYSSFILFEFFSVRGLPPKIALQQFNTLFPAKFKNSEEGNCIKKYITNRAVVQGQKKAISFEAEDIDNNKIVFKDIYDKKYVLLSFWGTWCGACIEEIPILREIRQQYSRDQLEIVSVAISSPVDKVREFIKNEHMGWVHIVNNDKIAQIYPPSFYPDTYLIDNHGNVIYKYSAYPDPQLRNLKQILKAKL